MPPLEELLDDLFAGRRPALYPDLEGWLRDSRRFRDFTVAHRTKIRAKVRNAADESALRDLGAELQAAALLLREPRFTLEYEKYAAAKVRGPDFTVTFKGHTPFNVEVRRLRSRELDQAAAEARTGRLMGVLADKAGQMPAGIANLLWLAAGDEVAPADLAEAAGALRGLAERKAEEPFVRRGYESAAAFLRQYRLLSGVVLCQPGRVAYWPNPLARRRLPAGVPQAIGRLRGGEEVRE
jgi:hypothetical protein